MTKYKAQAWWNRIEKIEVLGETEKFVTIMYGTRSRRVSKLSVDEGFFDTFEDAKKFIVDRQLREMERAENSLKSAQTKYSRAIALQEVVT